VTIIFDFDGTIADSFDATVQVFYKLTGHEQRLSDKELVRLRGLSMLQAVEELRIRPWKIPFLMMRGRLHMARRMKHISVQPGVAAVIRQLHDNGHQLLIVSSNSQRNIQTFLRRHHLASEFAAIYGGVGLFNKAAALKKVLHSSQLVAAKTYYISDEARDIAAAQAADMPVIAVAWGFNNLEILRKHQPTHLVETPEQLLDLLQ
jgi:phosphoglycolate phosphatase